MNRKQFILTLLSPILAVFGYKIDIQKFFKPDLEIRTISSEAELADIFGKPNFLSSSYSPLNIIRLVRNVETADGKYLVSVL
jgi:hypothetical protein